MLRNRPLTSLLYSLQKGRHIPEEHVRLLQPGEMSRPLDQEQFGVGQAQVQPLGGKGGADEVVVADHDQGGSPHLLERVPQVEEYRRESVWARHATADMLVASRSPAWAAIRAGSDQ